MSENNADLESGRPNRAATAAPTPPTAGYAKFARSGGAAAVGVRMGVATANSAQAADAPAPPPSGNGTVAPPPTPTALANASRMSTTAGPDLLANASTAVPDLAGNASTTATTLLANATNTSEVATAAPMLMGNTTNSTLVPTSTMANATNTTTAAATTDSGPALENSIIGGIGDVMVGAAAYSNYKVATDDQQPATKRVFSGIKSGLQTGGASFGLAARLAPAAKWLGSTSAGFTALSAATASVQGVTKMYDQGWSRSSWGDVFNARAQATVAGAAGALALGAGTAAAGVATAGAGVAFASSFFMTPDGGRRPSTVAPSDGAGPSGPDFSAADRRADSASGSAQGNPSRSPLASLPQASNSPDTPRPRALSQGGRPSAAAGSPSHSPTHESAAVFGTGDQPPPHSQGRSSAELGFTALNVPARSSSPPSATPQGLTGSDGAAFPSTEVRAASAHQTPGAFAVSSPLDGSSLDGRGAQGSNANGGSRISTPDFSASFAGSDNSSFSATNVRQASTGAVTPPPVPDATDSEVSQFTALATSSSNSGRQSPPVQALISNSERSIPDFSAPPSRSDSAGVVGGGGLQAPIPQRLRASSSASTPSFSASTSSFSPSSNSAFKAVTPRGGRT